MQAMKVLIDMGHPAHVHFFRHAIAELEKRGHSVAVTARDKDVTLKLLEAFKIPYTVRPDGWRPLNLLMASRFIAQSARAFGADRLVGVHNPYVAAAGVKLKKPCVLFTDTPGSKFVNRISVARVSRVVTPACLASLFSNQTTYLGYKEMAYLHPSRFIPDEGVLARHGLKHGESYFVVRFIEWKAYHDSGVRVMPGAGKNKLLGYLLKRGRVVACSEGSGPVPEGCIAVKNPEDVHSLLAFSAGYVGEGATMAKEAAVLGVPSVYLSPLALLPPIMEMEKTGAIVRMDLPDPERIGAALDAKVRRMEMFDVTDVVVRNALE